MQNNTKSALKALSAIFLFASAMLCVNAEQNIDRQASLKFHEAYDMMYVGRTLELQNLNEEALSFYLRAFDKLNEIQADFPNWRTGPMSERIEHCVERITSLSGKEPAKKPERAPVPETYQAPEKPRRAQAGEQAVELMIAREMEILTDFESAIDIYQEFFQNNPESVEAAHGLLRCHLAMGHATRALDIAEHAAVKSRTDLQSKTLAAMVYSANGRHEDAVLLLRQAGSEVFFDDSACVAIGVALTGTGREKAAIAYMRRALELNPERTDALYNLAKLFAVQTTPDLKAARENYNAYLAAGGEPDNALARMLR